MLGLNLPGIEGGEGHEEAPVGAARAEGEEGVCDFLGDFRGPFYSLLL